jgi:hypothetical protein
MDPMNKREVCAVLIMHLKANFVYLNAKTYFSGQFFVQHLGIKLKISISKMLPITVSFVQNGCGTKLYKSHLLSGDGISWV